MSYADRTDVPVGRSQDALRSLLAKHGAHTVGIVSAPDRIVVTFNLADRWIQFTVPLREQDTGARQAQEERARWRALLLVVRGRLESVETGIATYEEAFLANVVVPDGSTVAENVAPAIAASYRDGRVRPLLALGS